jgi:hypothetical protein
VNGSRVLCGILAACVAGAQGCHRFEACGPGVACDSLTGRGASGGVSGAGGAGDPQLGCAGSFADCDDAGVNQCEVNLKSDPGHCSACGRRCSGICDDGECISYAVAATNQVNPVASIVFTSEFAYFAAERVNAGPSSLRLQRVTRGEHSDVDVIADRHWASITGLAVTSLKLYVLSDDDLSNDDLYSLKLPDASELAIEPNPRDISIDSIDGQGPYLYLSDYWSVFRRKEGYGQETQVFHSPDATGVRVAASSEGFFALVASTHPQLPPRYEVHFGTHDSTEPALVASGQGSISIFSAYEHDVYFVVEDAQGFTLRRASALDGEQVVGTGAEHLTGLAASSANLIASVSSDFYDGLRAFGETDGEIAREWPTRSKVLALKADEDRVLWYFDEVSTSLVTLDPYSSPPRRP